jgi:hypothetical protein
MNEPGYHHELLNGYDPFYCNMIAEMLRLGETNPEALGQMVYNVLSHNPTYFDAHGRDDFNPELPVDHSEFAMEVCDVADATEGKPLSYGNIYDPYSIAGVDRPE